ncbi:serine/threonine-protein kinase [Sphaerisporangium sp. TRM90804]|uniref:serine/threonine-protein kinase n=1 Tax=Sphaerisporangium sp. TRM90804 TaxID=3031113 RepID=UPI0024497860|nr:serine/threonine-protein kinase [Sphaerisporangium sp. TRM90804]MDH2428134.1 protein kinase [Sphaerisporangium sp. TRM90804]
MAERLGRGGMGEVYLGVSRRGEQVAVKMLRDAIGDDPEARLRLEREVRALRRVESPYVARVLDADLSGDRPYLVMEYIEGETLLDAVRRGGPLPNPALIDLARGLATAVAIIHAAGVVHRDVKPANVVLGPDGPVLIDFGIAQVADATRLTMTGTFLGTPGYSAPEVFADEVVGEPSDVHSWAATVAFAATGRPTFGRGTAEAQMYAVLNGRADLKGVPGALLPLIRAALNREPSKRPTAALLADRLSRLARATAPGTGSAGGAVQATAAGRRPRAGKPADEPSPGRGRGEETPGEAARARAGEPPAPEADSTPPGGRKPGADSAPPGGRRPGADSTPPGGRKAGADSLPPGARKPGADSTPPGARRSGADSVPPGTRKPVAASPVARKAVDPPGGRAPRAAATAAAERVRTRRGSAEPAGRATGPDDRQRRPRTAEKEAVPAAEAAQGSGHVPPGSAVLIVLAMVAVPCVVASVIWPLATFGITAAFCVLARAWWSGHWLVRNRRSARVRGVVRVASFPLVLAGSALSAAAWPGVPAAAVAASAFWAAAGGRIDDGWWAQAGPMTVAGVAFGVICGAIVGREIERVGGHVPDLRREGLRALSVLGGFVALCAAAVRVLAWVIPHAL